MVHRKTAPYFRVSCHRILISTGTISNEKTQEMEKLLVNAAGDISSAVAVKLFIFCNKLRLFSAISQSEGMISKELAKYIDCAEETRMYGVALAGYLGFEKTSRRGVAKFRSKTSFLQHKAIDLHSTMHAKF